MYFVAIDSYYFIVHRVCRATCVDGYVFDSYETNVQRVCNQLDGRWFNNATLPACVCKYCTSHCVHVNANIIGTYSFVYQQPNVPNSLTKRVSIKNTTKLQNSEND